MLGFILFLLFIFIIWPIATIAWRIWGATRSYRDFVRRRSSAMEDRGRASASGTGATPRKRKKISRDTGEYIAFTEVEETGTVDIAGTTYSTTRVEQQVTDIEWEDL